MRKTLLTVVLIFLSAAPLRADKPPGIFRIDTGLALHASDFDANDGVLCRTQNGIYQDSGILCRRNCFSPSQGCSWSNLEMTGALRVAVGKGGRTWMVRAQDIVAEIDDQPVVITPLPESCSHPFSTCVHEFIMIGNPQMVTVGDKSVALDTPVVLMESGNAYVYIYQSEFSETAHWDKLPSGPFHQMSGLFSKPLGFQTALFLKQNGAVLEQWLALNGVGLLNTLPVTPTFGTNLESQHRYAVGGGSLITGDLLAADPAKIGSPRLGFFMHMDLNPKTFQWSWTRIPGNDGSRGGPFYVMEDTEIPPYISPSTFSGAGMGLTKLVGNQGFDGFDTDRSPSYTNLHGFVGVSFSRLKAIVSNPPPPSATPIEPWRDRERVIRVWCSDPFGGGLVATADDDLGGLVFTVPRGPVAIPGCPIPTYRLPMPRERIAVDVFIPLGAASVGGLEISAAVPAAGVWDTYLGYRSLDALPRGQWNSVELTLPASLKAALAGDYPQLVVNTTVTATTDDVQVRGLRFSGTTPTTPRPAHQALNTSARTNAFLSFEQAGDWTSPDATAEQTFDASHALHAVRLNTNGWTEIVSRPFSTFELPVVGRTLTVDVYVPSPRPHAYWLGSVGGYLSCPSKGVWGQWLGQADLTKLFPGEWNTVRLPLSTAMANAFRSGASDCSLRLAVNTAPTDSDPNQITTSFILDRVGFLD